MARKHNPRGGSPEREDRSAASYYDLKLKAVDDLVTADVTNSPKVSEEELRKYRSGPKLRLSDWAKALLIKFWFAGAVCFFFLWGLGAYLHSQLDQLVILGLALGAVTDLLTNNIFRFYAKTPGENDRFMMFPQKGFVTLPLNLLYAFLLLFCVVTTYGVINAAVRLVSPSMNQSSVPLGVGPILFGAFTTAWDTLWIKVKRTAQSILKNARRSAAAKED